MTSRGTFCSSTSTNSAISSTEDISDFICSTGLSSAHALIGRVSSIGFTDLDDCGYSFLIKKVLSTNDTSMEEIWNKMNLLVKGNQKISLNIISLLLKTISEYNIIDISNE